MLTLASFSSLLDKSLSCPSTLATNADSAKRLLTEFATSITVTPESNTFWLPSGKVIVIEPISFSYQTSVADTSAFQPNTRIYQTSYCRSTFLGFFGGLPPALETDRSSSGTAIIQCKSRGMLFNDLSAR